MTEVNIEDLKEVVDTFDTVTILVIGDLMLDAFIRGHVTRISDEAPVPVIDFTSEVVRLGGAANAIANIRALGGKVVVAGVIGDDPHGELLIRLLKQDGVNTEGIIVCHDRPTTVKTRIIAERNQQPLLRVDKENSADISPEHSRKILEFIRERIQDVEAIVISDYDRGVVTDQILAELIPLCKDHKKPIVVDSRVEHFLDYRGVTLVKVTLQVASWVTGVGQINETSIRNIGQWMLTQLGSDYVLITRGKDGMSLFEKSGNVTSIPSIAKEVKEATGVADTVTAVIALSLAVNSARVLASAVLANTSGGIVVGKLGSAVVTRAELKEQLDLLMGKQIVHEGPR